MYICALPEGLGKAVTHPDFFSWRGELFLSGKFLLSTEQVGLGDGMIQEKSCFLLLSGYSQDFWFHCVAEVS